MNKEKSETIDEKRGTSAGWVIEKREAIDFTPVYTFAITKELQPGDVLEWDTAQKALIYKGNNTTAT